MVLYYRKCSFCGRVPWLNQYWPGGFMVFVVLCPGTSEGSTGSGSGFKASQKTGQRFKVSSDRLGEAGNRTCDPWFTRHRFIPYTTAACCFPFPTLPTMYPLPKTFMASELDFVWLFISAHLAKLLCFMLHLLHLYT